MERGIKEMGEKLGVDASMIGLTSAGPALQVRAIEDLIAKGVNVIGVVPNDEKALEPVLEKARAAGNKVVAHEGSGLVAKDWDFEMASAKGFGETHAELFAQKAGGKGSYAVYMGSLTVPLHNAWADFAIAYLEEKYPGMKLVGERYGVAENVDDSRKTALEFLAANPDLVGFLAFGSQGPIGAGRATDPKVLILDSPTVGVGVGARAGIYRIVRELAAKGLAILLISDEVSEVHFNADRILHMAGGCIAAEFAPRQSSIQQLEEAVYA